MFLSLYALLLCNDALFIVYCCEGVGLLCVKIKCWFAQLAAGATATLEQATLTSSVWSRVNKRTSCWNKASAKMDGADLSEVYRKWTYEETQMLQRAENIIINKDNLA